MSTLFLLSIVSAAILLFQIGFTWKGLAPNLRKVFFLPSLIQLFAIAIALVRGGILPYFIPREVVTLLCYFFSVYISYTAILAIGSIDKKRKALNVALWIICAIGYWLLATMG